MSIQSITTTPPSWKEAHLDEIAHRISPEVFTKGGDPAWGRLIIDWNEIHPDGKMVNHTYAACIDFSAGELNVDCSPLLIFKKCLSQLLLRPIHIVAKTAYHATLIPVFKEISPFLKNERSIRDLMKTTVCCVIDIIRTPFYGLAIMAASVYVLARSLITPSTLYEGRKLIGQMEAAANRGKIHTPWTLTPCFQSIPLERLAEYRIQDYSADTLYPPDSPLDRQLTNFARSKVRHMQKYLNIITCTKLVKGERYVSPILLGEENRTLVKNPSGLCFYPVNIISS